MKKVGVVTGSRAEYGLLRPLIEKINKDEDLELQLIVTGMHLDYAFGLTYQEIEQDGYTIDAKIEMNLSADTSTGICKSMGLGMISFGEVYARLAPDILIVLGDRYEMFVAATAAMMSKIPLAHIHGGEITEGAYDDSLRHSISKMSYLHFTSTENARKRVIQLGEMPERVHWVGSLGVENIHHMKLLSKEALEQCLHFSLDPPTALVTFHPVTLEDDTASMQFENLLKALDDFGRLRIVFTKSNADTHGSRINQMIEAYVLKNTDKAVAFTSLGALKYLSVINFSCVVIGNSSSGIIEAPALKIPTVNIGDRQKGREQASSIINCDSSQKAIATAIQKALSGEIDVEHIVNPYEKANTSTHILSLLKQALSKEISLKKPFYDLGIGGQDV